MGHVLGCHAAGHEHGGIGLGAVGVTACDAVVLFGDCHNLIPHPLHINGAQYADAKQNPLNIVTDDGMVKNLFAPHGLNGNNVSILCDFIERFKNLSGIITITHIDHIGFAKIGGGGTVRSLQSILGQVIIHLSGGLSGNFTAPFWIMRHLKDMLIFNLQGGMPNNNHSFQSISVGFFIFTQQCFHGLFTARPGMRYDLGMHKSAADYNSPLGGHGILSRAEHHFRSIFVSHLGESITRHYDSPFFCS